MITKPTTVEQLKDLFNEMFLSTTNKVSKVSAGSVVNATSYGVAKVGQKILKDIANLEANIFPESSFGTLLDVIAQRYGVPPRLVATGSSTYIKLIGTVGTLYDVATVTFKSTDGIDFLLFNSVTIGVEGFEYAKIYSTTAGLNTNVDPFSVNQVTPVPVGNGAVANEYRAFGGRDQESDDLFRQRIIEGGNILATGTLSMYEQVFQKINPKVLRLYKGGQNNLGQYIIYVSPSNGADFTPTEFQQIKDQAENFLSLSESAQGLDLQNIAWLPIDVSMRLILNAGANPDTVRKNMQIQMQKILDWRYWKFTEKVEWDDLLLVAKQTRGVKRVLDNYFLPDQDINTNNFELPRIRLFGIYDEDGNPLSVGGNTLNPAFFPNQADVITQLTLYNSIP
jgi:hypothetical protein